MRVLQCIPRLSGGGAERQLSYLCEDLVGLGVDVHVVFSSYGPGGESCIPNGVVLHQFVLRNNHDPLFLYKVHALMRRLRPDVVQTWMRQMDVVGGMAAVLLGRHWVLSERSSRRAYPTTLKHSIRLFLARKASAIVANSESGLSYWRRVHGRQVRKVLIPNIVRTKEINAVSPMSDSEAGLPPEEAVILFAGRFHECKNLATLITALSTVLVAPGRSAILCGTGPLMGTVRTALKASVVAGRVRLPGYLQEQNVWRWMKRSQLFVSVSFYEGHPNSVLEAMAAGCPLVVSDIPEHRDFIDETCAILVKPDDPNAVSNAIVDVLQNHQQAAERAKRARERLSRMSDGCLGRDYLDLFSKLVKNDSNPCTNNSVVCAES